MTKPIDPTYKEYAQFFYKPNLDAVYVGESKGLKPRRHQMLMNIYLNPNKPAHKRLLLYHSTGSGKTKSMLLIARNFLDAYAAMRQEMGNSPQVFVLGYSRDIFVDTLMTTPEFGYISYEEIADLNRLFDAYNSSRTPTSYKAYRDAHLRIRSRISSVQIGGLFKFFGYMEFANKLGFGNPSDIQINQQFLSSLRNTLIIADEIHNTYNTDTLNSAGLAIKYTLDHHGDNIYFVCASATPINNNPAEIVDLTALLTGYEVNKSDLFTVVGKDIKTNRSALPGLSKLLEGHISYYIDQDPTAYPEYEFIGRGNGIPGINPAELTQLADVPLFKFYNCPVKPGSHQESLLRQYTTDEFYITDYIIRDMALPEMDVVAPDKRNLAEIHTSDLTGVTTRIPAMTPADLAEYAAKYWALYELLPNLRGKILIFHNRVNGSGIKFIESQIVRPLGYIREDEEPNDFTPCYECNLPRKTHPKSNGHDYAPARYNMIYSELDSIVKSGNKRRFNASANCTGVNIKIQLGAELVIQSVDYSCLQNIVAMSFPDNVPNVLQLKGRAVRRYAHQFAPPGWPPIKIFLMVTTFANPQDDTTSALTIEQKIYLRKFKWFAEVCILSNMLRDVSINDNSLDNDPPENPDAIEFHGYELNYHERAMLKYLILEGFNRQAQYTYDDLWAWVVTHPNVRIDLNSERFDKDLFNVVLTQMIEEDHTVITLGLFYTIPANTPTPPTFITESTRFKTTFVNMREILMDVLYAALIKLSKQEKFNPVGALDVFRRFDGDVHISLLRREVPTGDKRILRPYEYYNILNLAEQTFVDLRYNIAYVHGEQVSITPHYAPVVGYYERGVFKILFTGAAKDNSGDKRKNKRGIACKSLPRDTLTKLMRSLKIRNTTESSIHSVCDMLEEALLAQMQQRKSIISFSVMGKPLA
jgi:hypothetical protein